MQRSLVSVLISLAVFLVVVFLYFFGAFGRLEFFAYDGFQKFLRSDKRPSDKLKVILIDEASLKAMEPIVGRWPWPRAVWADLLEFLSKGGAEAVIFDVLFTERQGGINDEALVSATRQFGNVYHSMMILKEPEEVSPELGRPMPEDFVSRFSILIKGSLPRSGNNNFYLPFRELYIASKGIGVVEFTPDADGAFRRTAPVRQYRGNYFMVLGLAPFVDMHKEVQTGRGFVRIADRKIPIDDNGNCLINMYGDIEAYSIGGIFASLQKLRGGNVEDMLVSPEEFSGKIVFVGGSAVGVEDLKTTPLAPRTPGVMLHLSLASNYLLGDFMHPPNRIFTIFTALLGALSGSLAILYSRRFIFRVASPVILLLLFGAFSYFMYRGNFAVEVIPFTATVSFGSFLSFGYLVFIEARERRRVSRLFSQYVSEAVLEEVTKHGEYARTGGVKAEISVLFTDIRGFTTFSENTPPEKIVEMLNCFFARMADIILAHNGTLDKYIGDAIMAFWGAPVPDKEHALNAVTAAMKMLDALDDVNSELRQKGCNFELKIGIGINSGMATVGSIGSEKKLNYTAVGDTVNLASRLESLTKEYHTSLIISEYTYELIKDKISCTPLGSVRVKGREQPVWIYTPDKSAEGG